MPLKIFRNQIPKRKPQASKEFSEYKKITDAQQLTPNFLSSNSIFSSERYEIVASGSSDGITVAAGGLTSVVGSTAIGKTYILSHVNLSISYKAGSGVGRASITIVCVRGSSSIWQASVSISPTVGGNASISSPINSMIVLPTDSVQIIYRGVETGGVNSYDFTYSASLMGINISTT